MTRVDSHVRPPMPEPLPLLGPAGAEGVVDNHTHLDHEADDATVSALLLAAERAGVPRSVQISHDIESSRWTVRAVDRFPQLVGGVALHPNEAPRLAASGDLDQSLAEIEELAQHPRVRVVGETGMDRFRTDHGDRAAARAQEASFRAHIEMAKRLDLPLQIHDRDAHADVLRVLAETGAPERTVFHCFSGDAEMARFCAAHGWYLSFAGVLTFKNAQDARDALREVPLEQVLVETDAPYLTPMPYRGRPNAGYLVPLTVRAMAEVLDRPVEDVCGVISTTSQALYGPW